MKPLKPFKQYPPIPYTLLRACRLPSAAAIAVGLAACAGVSTAHAQLLTDIVLFRTDANGNPVAEGWNTRGGDGISNLYLKSSGSFINTGNAGPASISIDLSIPGVYTFDFAGDNVNANTAIPLGINFFFSNDAVTPGISARGPQSGGFFANGGATNTPSFGTVAGANTLTFVGSGRQITLTDFRYQTTGNPDQVSSFGVGANGFADTAGSFTLRVAAIGGTAAPEPGALALLIPAAGMIALTRRGRRWRAPR